MLNRRGFTLVELVVVLLLVAILSVFVAQRLGNVASMKAAAFVKKLRADIRYAQNVAMTRNRRARVYFNGAGAGVGPGARYAPAAGYTVVVDGASADCSAFDWVQDPSGTGYPAGSTPEEKAALKVELAAGDYTGIIVNPTTTCLEYNSLGSPYDCTIDGLGVCANSVAAAVGMTIVVPAAPPSVNTIAVAAGTGAVN